MFNVSALLLDDALLKCVVTDINLFSIVAFKTLIFHKVLQRHIWGMVWPLVNVITNFLLIPIVKTVWKLVNIWWRHTKNVPIFWGHPVYTAHV